MLSLKEKIGQLIIPRLDFKDPKFGAASAEDWIKEFHIGNFIVFGGEVLQVAETLNRLQSMSKIPILFSADLERGLGQQVKGATEFPYFMGLAEAAKNNDTRIIYDAAKITAIESRAAGIHQNYSPVLDINNNRNNPIINVRSFGDNTETVLQCAEVYIKGLQDYGMMATAKHFPGHGDTQVDSHKNLPVLPHSMDRLDTVELKPFQRAALSGIDAIMAGHIAVPAMDASGLPASLSQKMLRDRIRNQWHYEGLILTDALIMGAVTENFSEEEAVIQSLEAGADQLLLPKDPAKAFQIIFDHVKNHPAAMIKLETAVSRILQAKKKLGLFDRRLTDIAHVGRTIGCGDHMRRAQEITRECFILKKGKWPERRVRDGAVWLIKSERSSLAYLKENMRILKINETELDDLKISVPDLEAYSQVVVITDVKPVAWMKKFQWPEPIVKTIALQFQKKEHLLIACGNPYIADELPNLQNFVCTFNSGIPAQEEIIRRWIP